MSYAASDSTDPDARGAAGQVCGAVAAALGGRPPDLAVVLASRVHAEGFEVICAEVARTTRAVNLIGCTAEGIACGGKEHEEGPALALWCAKLPGASVDSFHVQFERTPDGPICEGLPETPPDSDDVRAIFLLGDPFSCPVDTLIARLADDLPGAPLIGGMASGGQAPGENMLALGDRTVARGGVGVIVRGGPAIRSVVSQGCRPIGGPLVVTRAEENILFELGGRPALARLEETYGTLSPRDRNLIRQGLHVGVVMDERKPSFARGDFLIANVLGADRESGAIAIGNYVRTGQTVQFHVRDAETADEDLRHLVSARLTGAPKPKGALLFTCNGRGTRLFSEPHHDAALVQELCGPIPLAGFFAQGELGPVGRRNYIHGFTASVALFD